MRKKTKIKETDAQLLHLSTQIYYFCVSDTLLTAWLCKRTAFLDDFVCKLDNARRANPGYKSYQKVVETMSTFCEKYKGLIPESEWNKIMNVMLVNGKVSDIKKALAEGMEWTLRHLNKLGKIDGDLSFEFSVKFPQGLKYKGAAPKRVADLKVCPKGKTKDCTYHEYKSVKQVPPTNFENQFAKDLLNDDVKKLNQLKWIFDGKKFPEGYDFKGKMKEAIRKMDIPNKALEKFGTESMDELKNDIIKNFDNIFQVK